LKWVSRKAVTPGEAELAENPRSRSAQLRVMEKI
jgi:16S rRNA C1402 N4-methylase RsmH